MTFPRIIKTILLCLSLCIPVQSKALDLLSESAKISSKINQSVLLSIALTGNRLVAVGERGFILISDNNGTTWQQAQVPVSVTLTAVFFTENAGWAVGHGGVVLKSEDKGNTWYKVLDGNQAAEIELASAIAGKNASRKSQFRIKEAQRLVNSGPDKPFLDIYFIDDNKGIIVGAYGLIFSTEDGGKTWKSLISELPNQKGMHLYNINLIDNYIYIAGEQGVVYKSGINLDKFEEIKTPYMGSFFGVSSSFKNEVLLFGLRGNVLLSSNKGAKWSYVMMPQPVTLTAGGKLKDGKIILADETGQLVISSDDGSTFTTIEMSQFPSITDFVEAPNGAIVLTSVRGLQFLTINKPRSGDK